MERKDDIEILHWGHKYLNLTDEQLEKYRKICNIQKGKYIYDSINIKNSSFISDSRSVHNSNHIMHATEVDLSDHIYTSNQVKNCSHLYQSNTVHDSEYIIGSNNINDSFGLQQCARVDESGFSYKCEDGSNIFFCAGCKDLTFGLFCSETSGQSKLFNKDYPFIHLIGIINEFCEKWLPLLKEEVKKRKYPVIDGHYGERIGLWEFFEVMPNEFVDWVKSLPGYDDMLVYRITMNKIWFNE